MKVLSIVVASFALLQVASATPCATGSLASYVALGSAGCTIGGDTVSAFTILTGLTGGTPISPTAVTVTPSGGTFNPVLTFSVSQTAAAPAIKEAIFDYSIAGLAFTSDVIMLSGSSETGNGAVTDIQNYCAGGHFGSDGVDGCTGSATGGLVAVDGVQQTDQTTLSKPLSLTITDDFVVDSGGTGSASGGTFADQFTGTPEPGAYLLTSTGLLLAFLRKSHLINRKL